MSTKQSLSTKQEKAEMNIVSYASIVDSLKYSTICTRLDITHTIGVVNQFLSNLGKEHKTTIKWISRYFEVLAVYICLCFGNDESILISYIDAQMVTGYVDSWKSTLG